MALLCAACWAVRGTLTVAMALAAMLPPNRGDLTVAEFAENVNFYRDFFDYGERWSLDENGEWAENQYENVVYFGGGRRSRAVPYGGGTERSVPCIGHIPRRRKRSTARAMRTPAWRTSPLAAAQRGRASSTSAA